MASYPNDESDTFQNEIQMDAQRATQEEWERNWAPKAREPKYAHFGKFFSSANRSLSSQMKDDTKIPLICFARNEDEKMSQDLFPWRWETKISRRQPIETISMHENFQRTVIGLKRAIRADTKV